VESRGNFEHGNGLENHGEKRAGFNAEKNQQRGIDRKAKPDIVSIMQAMDSPAEPDLSYIPK
jgi:hypothetical protein